MLQHNCPLPVDAVPAKALDMAAVPPAFETPVANPKPKPRTQLGPEQSSKMESEFLKVADGLNDAMVEYERPRYPQGTN